MDHPAIHCQVPVATTAGQRWPWLRWWCSPGPHVDLVPLQCKKGSIYTSDDELCLVGEQGEKHPNSHSQEVEVSALTNCMLGKPVSKPFRSFLCARVKLAGGLATTGQCLPKLRYCGRDGCAAPGCTLSRARTRHLADATKSAVGRSWGIAMQAVKDTADCALPWVTRGVPPT